MKSQSLRRIALIWACFAEFCSQKCSQIWPLRGLGADAPNAHLRQIRDPSNALPEHVSTLLLALIRGAEPGHAQRSRCDLPWEDFSAPLSSLTSRRATSKRVQARELSVLPTTVVPRGSILESWA
jgi:hypothetical protein